MPNLKHHDLLYVAANGFWGMLLSVILRVGNGAFLHFSEKGRTLGSFVPMKIRNFSPGPTLDQPSKNYADSIDASVPSTL